jgi:hypothetical protein
MDEVVKKIDTILGEKVDKIMGEKKEKVMEERLDKIMTLIEVLMKEKQNPESVSGGKNILTPDDTQRDFTVDSKARVSVLPSACISQFDVAVAAQDEV